MTEKDIGRYLALVERRLFILMHSGIDWKPEYSPELDQIDRELAALRKAVEQEHLNAKKEKTISRIPTMKTIKEAAAETGLSYDFIRKLCLQKRIVCIKAGCKYLINMEKLSEFLNGEEVGA